MCGIVVSAPWVEDGERGQARCPAQPVMMRAPGCAQAQLQTRRRSHVCRVGPNCPSSWLAPRMCADTPRRRAGRGTRRGCPSRAPGAPCVHRKSPAARITRTRVRAPTRYAGSRSSRYPPRTRPIANELRYPASAGGVLDHLWRGAGRRRAPRGARPDGASADAVARTRVRAPRGTRVGRRIPTTPAGAWSRGPHRRDAAGTSSAHRSPRGHFLRSRVAALSCPPRSWPPMIATTRRLPPASPARSAAARAPGCARTPRGRRPASVMEGGRSCPTGLEDTTIVRRRATGHAPDRRAATARRSGALLRPSRPAPCGGVLCFVACAPPGSPLSCDTTSRTGRRA